VGLGSVIERLSRQEIGGTRGLLQRWGGVPNRRLLGLHPNFFFPAAALALKKNIHFFAFEVGYFLVMQHRVVCC